MADRGGAGSGGAGPNHVVLATASHDGSIKYWHAASGTSNRTIPPVPLETQVNCLTISNDKHFLAAGGNTTLRLFDTTSNNAVPVMTYQGHTNNITNIVFQREGKWLASGSEDGTIKIWDVRAPGVQRELSCGSSAVSSIALHGNQGELISCDEDGAMRIWDLGTSRTTLECTPAEHISCSSVAINYDSTMIALANHAGHCYIWKLPNATTANIEPCEKLEVSHSYLTKVLFSPNGKYLATCSADHSCKLWLTGGATGTTTGSGGTSSTVASPASPQTTSTNTTNMSGSILQPGSTGQSPAPAASSFELYRELQDHHGWVWDASFSADSSYLVTASSDRSAKLWDIATSEVLLEYRGHSRGLTSVALNDT